MKPYIITIHREAARYKIERPDGPDRWEDCRVAVECDRVMTELVMLAVALCDTAKMAVKPRLNAVEVRGLSDDVVARLDVKRGYLDREERAMGHRCQDLLCEFGEFEFGQKEKV